MKKELFKIIHNLGECQKKDSYHIYKVDEDDGTRYRVDCGEQGSFEIAEINGAEEYCLKNNDWIYVEGKWWMFHCLSETFSGYPKMTPEQALKTIKNDKQTIEA